MRNLKMNDDYKKAYREIYEILMTLSKEDVNKIPKNIRDMIEFKMDKEYTFNVDINKTFEEQNFSDKTKAIIANLFRDYWATPYQREKIIENQNIQRRLLENEKKIKYNSDIIFNNRNVNDSINKVNDNIIENVNLPVEVKNKTFFESIIDFIKKIFKL